MSLNLIITDVDLTLMMIDSNGDYAPSSAMTFQYFIIANEEFVADLDEKTKNLMMTIYNEHYQTFREREPNDLNYIAVVGVNPLVFREADYKYKPWLRGKCPAWESSNCIIINENGYQKFEPNLFAAILGVS